LIYICKLHWNRDTSVVTAGSTVMAGPNVPDGSIGSVLPINGGSDQQMSGDGGGSTSNLKNKFVNLCSLGLAHNQLGPSAGKALSLLIKVQIYI
jgi:hypothetical protein